MGTLETFARSFSGKNGQLSCRICHTHVSTVSLNQHLEQHDIKELSDALTNIILKLVNLSQTQKKDLLPEKETNEEEIVVKEEKEADDGEKSRTSLNNDEINLLKIKKDVVKVNKKECDICQKKFASFGNLKKHKVIHSNDASHKFKCSQCPLTFNRNRDRNTHEMQKHTGERPYVCKLCQKGFVHKFYLNEHLDYHTGNKRHQCYKCGKKFTSSSALAKHTSRHKTERSFKCDACPKEFVVGCDLKAHKKFVHDKVGRDTGIPVFPSKSGPLQKKTLIPPPANYELVSENVMAEKEAFGEPNSSYQPPRPAFRAINEKSSISLANESQTQIEEWMISQGFSVGPQPLAAIRIPSVGERTEVTAQDIPTTVSNPTPPTTK